MPETTFHTTFSTSHFLLSRAKNGSESELRSAVSYRFGFNGKENDNEVKGTGNSVDFGARIYDSRLGRFLSCDRYSSKFPSFSPYLFAGNIPVSAIDVNGDSLYILIAASGYSHGDDMFYAAALTRQYDIEHSANFDPARDKVVVLQSQDVSDIKASVEKTVKTYSGTYGKTAELGVWSHSGLDGPIGSVEAKNNPLYEGSTQMSLDGWANINFNWYSNARAGFYGCNSGNNSEGKSFTTKLSGFSNFQNVNVFGQTTSSYPSSFTNERSITSYQWIGDYLPIIKYVLPLSNYLPPKIVMNKTYMVGGDSRESFWSYMSSTNANPMQLSKNGKVLNSNYYQQGDKK